MKIPFLIVAVAAIVLLPATGLAAEADATAPSDPTISVPHNGAVLQSVIDAVAAKTHKHFLVSPYVQGAIDLGTWRLRDIDYPTLVALLSLNGYVTVDTSSGVVITRDTSARQLPTRIYSPKSISALDDEWVTVVMPVKGISAAQLVPVLRPLMPQAAQLSAVVGRNALLIVDSAANVKRMVAIVEALEALPPEPAHADQSPN
jgi:general secretion pathway protein D